jgi:hypothetical protein
MLGGYVTRMVSVGLTFDGSSSVSQHQRKEKSLFLLLFLLQLPDAHFNSMFAQGQCEQMERNLPFGLNFLL